MIINNHKLYYDNGAGVPYFASPNKTNYLIQHKYIVTHYTTGSSPIATISWFQDPAAQVSAHLLIDREGKIYQFVPFNLMAWHAGSSQYPDPENKETMLTSLNKYSIGIEMDNGGCAKWVQSIDPSKKVWSKHPKMSYYTYWEKYTTAQLNVLNDVCKLLVETYGIKEAVGHEDISLSGKVDPGPVFPKKELSDSLFTDKEEVPQTLEERVATLELQVKKLQVAVGVVGG